VLSSTPPRFTAPEVAAIADQLFGLGGEATDLGSERDQTFLISGAGDEGVVKISNTGEDMATLELEASAIEHVTHVDPSLPVARLRASATFSGPEGSHFVRLFERLRGHHGGPELGDDAVRDFTATQARLTVALRGFFSPAAGRDLLWDLAHTLKLRPLTGEIADPERRRIVEAVLDRFEERVAPIWAQLPAQIVHGDFNLDNVLLDERDRVSGIVDFGDIGHTAVAGDLAVAIASVMRDRPLDDVFRVARIAIDGYTSRAPLSPEERDLLGELVAARLATIVTISAWRVARYPENATYIQAWDDGSWALLELRDRLGAERFNHELGGSSPPAGTAALAARRERVLGALLTPLTYEDPVHLVRGQGVWLFEPDGRALLDAYNNVPVVGHCHPRVTEAVARQTRRLNTHARYLYEPLVELGERLVASMPEGLGLDTVMVLNSGSEANDLAWRIACGVTGRDGALVTCHAYHGVTTAVADLSPEEWPPGHVPAHVARIPPGWDRDDLTAALAGRSLAATFLDAGLTSDGIFPAGIDAARSLARVTRDAGGLFVADEVQVGHGRSGQHLWAFAALGLEPDFVTLGKPMGDGYPVAALVTRRELVQQLPYASGLFSTFGGNPVAAVAALSVLDVIEDERLIARAGSVGELLRARIAALGSPAIREVRGLGLLVGVELTDERVARAVVNALRRDGVLVGRTGPGGEVLKIRPPLVFGEEHVEPLVSALERALDVET